MEAKINSNSKIITISLPWEAADKAKQYASTTGRKFSTLVAISLERFIQEESKRGVSVEHE